MLLVRTSIKANPTDIEKKKFCFNAEDVSFYTELNANITKLVFKNSVQVDVQMNYMDMMEFIDKEARLIYQKEDKSLFEQTFGRP